MGWTDNQVYQRVPSYKNPKSYLKDGRATKDTDRYLDLEIY